MKDRKTIVSATLREFEERLRNFVVDNYGIRIQPYNHFDKKNLQYSYRGSLIVYKVVPLERKVLEVEVSVPMNSDEASETHANEVFKEIRKMFRSGDFPFGFRRFIYDEEQCKTMENLWIESYKTQDAEAYLSTIVLLGSILEGILYYQITKTEENKALAGKARYPSDEKNGRKIKKQDFHEWFLQDMINVCYKCGWINKQYFDYSNVLREHRNFIHP